MAATTGIADVPDTTLQPVTNPVDLSDFDELGVIPHSSPVEQTVMPDLPAPEAVQPPVRSCAPSISGHQQPNKPNSSGVRRSLSKEFASHPATRTESNRALRELQPGNTQQLDPASTSVLVRITLTLSSEVSLAEKHHLKWNSEQMVSVENCFRTTLWPCRTTLNSWETTKWVRLPVISSDILQKIVILPDQKN